MEYRTLEGKNLEAIGVDAPNFNGNASSFATTSGFVYTLFFTAIVIAASYRYVTAGTLRLQASESSIRASNQIIKQVTLGLLGVFSLFLILFTVNKGMLTGDIGLDYLRSGEATMDGVIPVTAGVIPYNKTVSGSNSSSRSCESPQVVIKKLEEGNVCGNVTCGVLNGCSLSEEYKKIINEETEGNTQLYKMIVATMCKESKGKPNAQFINKDSNGNIKSYDCGLMQINQLSPCESNPSPLSQKANIKRGVEIMKEKIRNTSIYPVVGGVPFLGNVFASYNCCSSPTIPASPSDDCKKDNGFREGFPKWACPINPGDGQFNMCFVKSYACELVACMEKIPNYP